MSVQVDVTFHPRWWHKNSNVSFNEKFFYDVDYRIEADIRMRKTLYEKFGDLGLGEEDPKPRPILGSDLIASGFLYSGILGCKVRYSDADPPEVVCANLDEESIMKLDVPNLDNCEAWSRIQVQIDRLMKDFGYINSCINLMGIQNIALDVRGMEFFIDYYTNPDLANHLLDVCTRLSVDIGKRLKKVSKHLSAGVTSIVSKTIPDVYVTSNCSVEMVSLDIYENYLLKYDNILAEEFKPFGIHHCGKSMEHVAEGYAKVKNLSFAEVGAGSDIKSVRSILGDIHLNARYSPVKLMDVSEEELKKDICKLAEDGKPLDLLSFSCVGIDESVPDRQVRNFIRICREIG